MISNWVIFLVALMRFTAFAVVQIVLMNRFYLDLDRSSLGQCVAEATNFGRCGPSCFDVASLMGIVADLHQVPHDDPYILTGVPEVAERNQFDLQPEITIVFVIDHRKVDGLGSAQKLLEVINGFEVLKLRESFHLPIINHPPPYLDSLHTGKGWGLCMPRFLKRCGRGIAFRRIVAS